ncbi:type II secretion system F family protein [Thalassolituus sp. C2-1]|uniref:type II secretion system F family protein n=1 Tax=Venatorbacter sp. C2-1 TaxID=2597518 RepID=UPI0011971FA3|nr:type II secretion system F family protein [Thalassolituus sp. C2-1]TVV42600.1 type II secretion system F family protein [Thalassolituus sp. C2-1]
MAKQIKNSAFAWEGINRRGQTIKGEMSGQNAAMVKAQLRKQGVNPLKVRKVAQPLLGMGGLGKKKIKSADITFFTRQMATMIKAGVPLVQSFDIVADGIDNPSMKELILGLRDTVSAGNDFASALKQHPEYFDDLTCNLVESGEQAGALEAMLEKVAIYKEKTEVLKAKIKKAMTYPLATLVVAFVVTAILLIKVVPTFDDMFRSFGSQLPAPTQFVVYLSEQAQAYYLHVLGVLAVAGVFFSQAMKRSPAFRNNFERLTLKLPVFGDLIRKAAVARYARVLSTTFAAGVPLVEALESVAGAVGNVVYREAVLKIRDEVSSGQQMHFAMRSTGVFPNMVVQMTSIGEESGALDAMLDKAATYFEDEVDNAVDNMTALLEPMIMAFLGVVIGGLIIAMYLPIFEMGKAI